MRIVFEDDEERAEAAQRLREAENRLRACRAVDRRMRARYLAGLDPACTIPLEERHRLIAEFFKRGGRITKVPPAAACGATLSSYWNVDRTTAIKNIREQIEAGRSLEAALAGTGLTPTEAQIELEEKEE